MRVRNLGYTGNTAPGSTILNGSPVVASGIKGDTPPLSSTAPPAIAATSSPGTGTNAAREDHTHAGVSSVNGQTGAVTVAAGKAAMTLTVANAISTTETAVARWAIPANTIEANDGINIVVKHQSAGTATVIWRLRCGATGTTTDTLLSQNTTSAAQVANAQGQWQGAVFFPATNQARGGGLAVMQAVVLGQTTAAQPTATINPAAVVFVSVTVQLSAAQASVTTAAVASWGDQ